MGLMHQDWAQGLRTLDLVIVASIAISFTRACLLASASAFSVKPDETLHVQRAKRRCTACLDFEYSLRREGTNIKRSTNA